MFERKTQRLLTRAEFVSRVIRHLLFAIGGMAGSLAIGVLGYHFLDHLAWIDALVDASMILGGMGPVSPLNGNAAKVFAALYALFSGLFFIAMLGFLLGPFAHRLMHHFHFEEEPKKAPKKAST